MKCQTRNINAWYFRFRIEKIAMRFYILFLVIFCSMAWGEANPIRKVPSSVLLTADGTMRVAEGELVLFCGDPPVKISPFMLHVPAAGTIAFSTTEAGCRYYFSTAQKKVGSATTVSKVGILSVTLTNLASPKTMPAFWVAWRPNRLEPIASSHSFGFTLEQNPFPSSPWIPDPFNWDHQATWYFHDHTFIQDGKVIYEVKIDESWESDSWVRRITLPYNDLKKGQLIGFSRFQTELAKGESSFLQVKVPFQPEFP